jgi:CHAT domain-containing protein
MWATGYRDSIFFEWRLARQVSDLIQDLNETRPNILHFSGHGDSRELVFEDGEGHADPLTNDQLGRLLDAAPSQIRLVVFNSCDSASQARLATKRVDLAIGMEATVDDDAAQTFAAEFYNSLGFGNSVAKAFEQARFQVEAEHGEGHEVPQLFWADGIDPHTIALVNPDD